MFSDLRYLVRSVRRSPASAAAAVVTLALTLGAGAAIFAIVDAVLLTPPPFENPGALVLAGEAPAGQGVGVARPITFATFAAWRDRAASLAALEAMDGTNLTLTELGAASRLSVNDCTPGLLTLLGTKPARGRIFIEDDFGRPVVVVSHAFWRDKLASDAGAIGRQLMLGGVAHEIIGVLPESFAFALSRAALWRPLQVPAAQARGSGIRVRVIGRLVDGVTASALSDALDEVSRAGTPVARAVATSLVDSITGGARRTLGLLAGAGALAVLIALTNLAGLLLVRSIDRRRELAVRTALGASSWQIARQLLLESQLLVFVGAVGGALLAFWVTPTLGRLTLAQFGEIANRDVAVNWRVIAALASIAAVSAALCGAVPSLSAGRQNVIDALRRGVSAAPRELWLRRLFATGIIAIAFILLVSVSLLGRSLHGVLGVNPGFDARGVLALQVSVPSAAYRTSDRVVFFYSALEASLEQRLGPRAVSITNEIPLTGDSGRRLVGATQSAAAGHEAAVRETGAAYFDVMRIPLVAGRVFDASDDANAPPRVIVSQALAVWLLGSKAAIGRQLWFAGAAQPAEVVGVVGDVRHRSLDEPTLPTVYLPRLQSPSRSVNIVARSTRPDADVIAAVREEVGKLDGSVPVYSARTLNDIVAASPGVPARQVLTVTFVGFALVALALGAIGLFGVVSHDVTSRRSELALRIALGADPSRMFSTVIRQGALIVGPALLLGTVLSFWAARALGGMVFGTEYFNVLNVGGPALVLLAAGFAAVLPAALRAARTDPLITLRND